MPMAFLDIAALLGGAGLIAVTTHQTGAVSSSGPSFTWQLAPSS